MQTKSLIYIAGKESQTILNTFENILSEIDNTISNNKNYGINNYSNTSDSESGSHISHSSYTAHSTDSPTDELHVSSPRNVGHINRIRPHSDVWICEDCSVKGDR